MFVCFLGFFSWTIFSNYLLRSSFMMISPTLRIRCFFFCPCFVLATFIRRYNLKTIPILLNHQFVFITDFLVSKFRVFRLASEARWFLVARYFTAHYGHIINRATNQIHTLLWQLKLLPSIFQVLFGGKLPLSWETLMSTLSVKPSSKIKRL